MCRTEVSLYAYMFKYHAEYNNGMFVMGLFFLPSVMLMAAKHWKSLMAQQAIDLVPSDLPTRCRRISMELTTSPGSTTGYVTHLIHMFTHCLVVCSVHCEYTNTRGTFEKSVLVSLQVL